MSGMTSITRYRVVPDRDDPRLRPCSAQEQQRGRTHPDRPIKDRSAMERFPAELTASRIRDLGPGELAPRRQHVLNPSRDVKAVAYNTLPGSRVATTGTSQVGVPCLTDGMGPCIAVAIGGERVVDGSPREGAKARIFYVFPDNVDVPATLGAYIKRLQDDGLTVRAALHGGEEDLAKSRDKAAEIRSLLGELGVQVDFDESCERRDGRDTLLGAVVSEDNEVNFVTGLAQRL
jgi:hypothetical protein